MLFQLKERNDALESSNGLIRSVNSFSSEDDSSARRLAPPRSVIRLGLPNLQNRPVSPVSNPDPRTSTLPRTRASRVPSEPVARRTRHGASTSTHLSPAGLATPETEHNVGSIGETAAPKPRMHSANFPRREPVLRSPLSAEIGPVGAMRNITLPENRELQSQNVDSHEAPGPGLASPQNTSFASTQPTSQPRPDLTSQLSAIDNALAQDMCLPSPSLSPVAAMNALHGESSFDSEGPDVDTDSSLDHNVSRHSKATRLHDGESSRTKSLSSRSAPSLMDMPKVLEFFDSVPEELKTYLMYQFLRRCPKPTLHFRADVVNPI
jgi:hypothetical protein